MSDTQTFLDTLNARSQQRDAEPTWIAARRQADHVRRRRECAEHPPLREVAREVRADQATVRLLRALERPLHHLRHELRRPQLAHLRCRQLLELLPEKGVVRSLDGGRVVDGEERDAEPRAQQRAEEARLAPGRTDDRHPPARHRHVALILAAEVAEDGTSSERGRARSATRWPCCAFPTRPCWREEADGCRACPTE